MFKAKKLIVEDTGSLELNLDPRLTRSLGLRKTAYVILGYPR